MKTITLIRTATSLQGTTGVLQFGASTCDSLELPWKDNASRISCIPAGTYPIVWAKSPHMGMCYHLVGVAGRFNVLIHAANFAGSEADGFVTQLQGCIAPCTKLGTMRNAHGAMQLAGLISKPALHSLEKFANKETCTLIISWKEGILS